MSIFRESMEESVRLARLLNQGRNMGLDSATIAMVEAELLDSILGVTASPTTGLNPLAVDETVTAERLDLRLRHLVQSDAPWRQIAPTAWQLHTLSPTPEIGAHLFELAFLHGEAAELDGTIEQLLRQPGGAEFYRFVHSAVRAQASLRLWRERSTQSLIRLLFELRDGEFLLPIERLMVFSSLAPLKDPTTPYQYFRDHKEAICSAASDAGETIGMPRGRLLLTTGQMALDLDHEREARALFSRIQPEDIEYQEALDLLLQLAPEMSGPKISKYLARLSGEKNGLKRVALIESFLAASHALGASKDRNRAAINEILRDPLQLLPPEPRIWNALSKTILKYQSLSTLIPNLLMVFRTNAIVFHSPEADRALWGPFFSYENQDSAEDHYWRGIAHLHFFVSTAGETERDLWAARREVLFAQTRWAKALPYSWKDLHWAASQYITRSPVISEQDRPRLASQMSIAADASQLNVTDFDDYLKLTQQPPVEILQELETAAQEGGQVEIEAKAMKRRAGATHYRNQDLDRLWHIACEGGDHILAWRCATVLAGRKALSPDVIHAWEICGEKRVDYIFTPLKPSAIVACTQGLSPAESALIFACFSVGPRLPELFSLLDSGATSQKKVPPKDMIESKVYGAISRLGWIDIAQRRFHFSTQRGMGDGLVIPPFMQALPRNTWSILLATVANELGINAWGWKLSVLRTYIDEINQRLATHQTIDRQGSKIPRLFSMLSHTQRAAWHELSKLMRILSDEDAAYSLGKVLCRFTTALYPAHQMALMSLQSVHAPVAIIWDHEQWQLSDSYQALRSEYGNTVRAPIPNTLRRLPSILA